MTRAPDAGLAGLERWLMQALAALDPEARRRLLLEIGRDLRRRNQRRIGAQIAPDGIPWEPRRRDRWGRIRSTAKMLQGLRETRRLALKTSPAGLELGYSGRNRRLASVHHFGEVDAVEPGGPQHQYAARLLLGLPAEDVAAVRARILAAIEW